MTADNFFVMLASERLGWKDIHATNDIKPSPEAQVSLISCLYREIGREAMYSLHCRVPSLHKKLKRIGSIIRWYKSKIVRR